MKYHEKVKTRIDCGNYPQYETQKGKLLWVDDSIYDSYCSSAHCKILVDANGKFWGYSDNPKIKEI